jgi:hypothetical protein
VVPELKAMHAVARFLGASIFEHNVLKVNELRRIWGYARYASLCITNLWRTVNAGPGLSLRIHGTAPIKHLFRSEVSVEFARICFLVAIASPPRYGVVPVAGRPMLRGYAGVRIFRDGFPGDFLQDCLLGVIDAVNGQF